MESEQKSHTIDLVDFLELESEEKQELLFEFVRSDWEETEECHGRPVTRRGFDISDETYYLNGAETTFEQLEGKYGEDEMESISIHITEELG